MEPRSTRFLPSGVCSATSRAPALSQQLQLQLRIDHVIGRRLQGQDRQIGVGQPLLQPVVAEARDRGRVDQHLAQHHEADGQGQQPGGQAPAETGQRGLSFPTSSDPAQVRSSRRGSASFTSGCDSDSPEPAQAGAPAAGSQGENSFGGVELPRRALGKLAQGRIRQHQPGQSGEFQPRGHAPGTRAPAIPRPASRRWSRPGSRPLRSEITLMNPSVTRSVRARSLSAKGRRVTTTSARCAGVPPLPSGRSAPAPDRL